MSENVSCGGRESSGDTKPLVILPALNCASSLRSLLPLLPRSRTLVVDDGSEDETSRVAADLGVMLLRHDRRLGVGAALQSGVSFARAHEFDSVTTLDADGQHQPKDVPRFEASLDHHDFVIGCRFSTRHAVPSAKLASNTLASLLAREIIGLDLRDVTCGFRSFRLSEWDDTVTESGYGLLYHQLFGAHVRGCSVHPLDIECIYPSTDPLCTRRSEILGFLVALRKFARQPSDLNRVNALIAAFQTNNRVALVAAGHRFDCDYDEAHDAFVVTSTGLDRH